MLPRSRKLTREVFPRRTERSVSWSGAVLRIVSYPQTGVGGKKQATRFGLVVPGRFGDGAVSRNKFRRAAFSALKDKLSLFDDLPYTKHTLFPLKNVESVGGDDILRDIERFLSDKRA